VTKNSSRIFKVKKYFFTSTLRECD